MLDLFFALDVRFVQALQRVQILSPLVFHQPHDSETTPSQLLDDLKIVQFKPLRFSLDRHGFRGGCSLMVFRQEPISAAGHQVLILGSVPDSSTTVWTNFRASLL